MKNITIWDAIELDKWNKLPDSEKAIHKLENSELYKKVREVSNAK